MGVAAMNWRTRMSWTSLVLVGLAAGACGGNSSGGDEGPQCVGAKCDDVDDPTASATSPGEEESGPIDPPPEPRADLGVDPPTQCDSACTVLSECLGGTVTDCQLDCTTARQEAAAVSSGCASAYDATLACVAGLDCAEAADYQAGLEGYPCSAEEDAALVACTEVATPTACEGFCTLAAMCDGGDAQTCQALCAESLANAEAVGAGCGAAQIDVFECVGALGSCDEFAAWSTAEGEYPCAGSDVALVAACNQGEG
jgi:hypothetical protein